MMPRVRGDVWAVIVLARETDEISRERFHREKERKRGKKEGREKERLDSYERAEIEIVSLDRERKLEDSE